MQPNADGLHPRLAAAVAAWREAGYPCPDHPAIAEVFEWAHEDDSGTLRYLRRPQLRALEIYWFVRLIEKTPHIIDLYRKYFKKQSEFRKALGLDSEHIKEIIEDEGLSAVFKKIKTNDRFVRDHKLEALRETLTLDYPSYILALAMGAGKTVLIGSIIATEFALGMEYPEGPFVRNALVFAPGKTILEALRELAAVPYDKIIPPRWHKHFAASVKLTFTRDGEKNIPVIPKSLWNIVVTNTEKIRIQKETVRKSDLGGMFAIGREDEARAEVANLRLQTIAGLPDLAVFSDEAHHTYGQSMDSELKRVRQTVDYLAANTNVRCVVNTTGTPYFQRQPLKDVIIWYGLSEGIRDGILKDLAGNIQAYDFAGNSADYLRHVIADFFRDYGAVKLPNGASARLAIYFPQTDDLKELKPVVDAALLAAGQSPAVALINTSDESMTKTADIDAFNRLNDPAAPQRVMLLVNKGTEGWNCPSLFACALARKLKSSNNFVLQAATRCLRQVAGNTVKARVYLSNDNYSVLDRQLSETYGETIADLNRAGQESRRARIVLKKLDLPPLVVSRIVRTVVRGENPSAEFRLRKPDRINRVMKKTTYTVMEPAATFGVLRQLGDTVELQSADAGRDAYAAAAELAAIYRIETWRVYDELSRIYGVDDIPELHFSGLAEQIEEQTRSYTIREEKVEVALALVKPDGFVLESQPNGTTVWTAEIVYPKDKDHLLVPMGRTQAANSKGYGFHYEPYNFDSRLELDFFEQVLTELNLKPREIEDIYFTGALTGSEKTDFFVEYRDLKGRWRRYTPDFIIRRKPAKGKPRGSGKVYIIELKAERERSDAIEGETGKKAMAVRAWEKLDPERLKYHIIFSATEAVPADGMRPIRQFIGETDNG